MTPVPVTPPVRPRSRYVHGRWRWNSPRVPAWIGFTVATRVAVVVVLILAATGRLG